MELKKVNGVKEERKTRVEIISMLFILADFNPTEKHINLLTKNGFDELMCFNHLLKQ